MIHIAQKSRRNQGAIKPSINGLFKVLSHANFFISSIQKANSPVGVFAPACRLYHHVQRRFFTAEKQMRPGSVGLSSFRTLSYIFRVYKHALQSAEAKINPGGLKASLGNKHPGAKSQTACKRHVG